MNIYDADNQDLITLRDDIGWTDRNDDLIEKLSVTVMVLCKRVKALEQLCNKETDDKTMDV